LRLGLRAMESAPERKAGGSRTRAGAIGGAEEAAGGHAGIRTTTGVWEFGLRSVGKIARVATSHGG